MMMVLINSRKCFSENLDELLKQLNAKVIDNDYSKIGSDENGCFVFPSSFLLSQDIRYLTSKACDIPINEITPVKTYYCICSYNTICSECFEAVDVISNDISDDTGDGKEIRVHSNAVISSSIFTTENDVFVDSNYNIHLTNVEKIDLSDTSKMKIDLLSVNSDSKVIVEPKTSQIEITLPNVESNKDYYSN